MSDFIVNGPSGQFLHANASQSKAEQLSEINRLRRQLDEAEQKIIGQGAYNSGTLYEAPDVDELASDRHEATNASAGDDYQAPDI
ncbi:hypothetical protein ACUN9V_05710 [Salinicola sp. V024]|uniref:hypothetical protein n=1 Tax=Salinicola sp. V024 TaxID=3459609 RepID=UPI004044A611